MRRGEIGFARLDPVRGSEQAGTHPILILQPDALNTTLQTDGGRTAYDESQMGVFPSRVAHAAGIIPWG